MRLIIISSALLALLLLGCMGQLGTASIQEIKENPAKFMNKTVLLAGEISYYPLNPSLEYGIIDDQGFSIPLCKDERNLMHLMGKKLVITGFLSTYKQWAILTEPSTEICIRVISIS